MAVLLFKEGWLGGGVVRLEEIAEAYANKAETLLGAEADPIP